MLQVVANISNTANLALDRTVDQQTPCNLLRLFRFDTRSPIIVRMVSATDDSNLLGDELLRVRKEAGLSQEQMAARVGLGYAPGGRKVSTARATVSAWERGRREPNARQLAVYLALGGSADILARAQVPPPNIKAALGAPAEDRTAAPVARRQLRVRARWLGGIVAVTVLAVLATILALLHVGHQMKPPQNAWTETTGTPAHTWADPVHLTGAGAPLGPRQSVIVTCRVRGYVVPDGDPWWYRLYSSPWHDAFYATSDAFYNNGAISGPVDTGVVVDEQIPVCAGWKS